MYAEKPSCILGLAASKVTSSLPKKRLIELLDAVTALSWSWDKLNVAAGSAKGALHVYELLNMGSVFSIRNAHQGNLKDRI